MALGLTYRGVDVFAPTDESGAARPVENQQAQVWSADMERYVSALSLSTNAAVVKGTLPELNAVVDDFDNGDIGLVVTGAERGVYKKVVGAWVKQSDLPQDLAEAAQEAAEQAQSAAEAAQESAKAAENSAEAARDIAAGYASDAVSQGNVPIYATIAGMGAINVPAGINAIRVNGLVSAGDGNGGFYIATNNGSNNTFVSGDGRTWYKAYADGSLDEHRVYAVYADGYSRSITDRSKDYIVVQDLSDGSGSPSNDDVAFQDALDIAASSDANQKVLLVTRPFQLLTEKNLPVNCNIWNAHGDGRIFANANMRSVFNVDKDALTGAGVGVCLKDLTIGNRDNLYTNAQALVRVNKGWNNQAIKLLNITAFAANKVVDWIDGDYPIFDNINAYSCVDALYFRNNGMNGSIKGLKTLGGRAIYINKASGGQQMEGTQFFNVSALPSGPINGQTPFGVEIKAALKLGFHGLLLDQVAGAAGLMIDGTASAISAIEIYNLWIGSAVNQPTSSWGMFVKGNVSELKVFGGEVVDIHGVGMQFDGMGSTIGAHLIGVRGRLNSSLDLYAADAKIKLDTCTFSSANTISAASSSYITGEDNTFTSGAPVLNGKFNLLRSVGPAAPALGLPTSPTGYPPGWFYSDSGTVKVT